MSGRASFAVGTLAAIGIFTSEGRGAPLLPDPPAPTVGASAGATSSPQSAPHGLAWNPRWPRFRAWEYVGTGVVGIYSLYALMVAKKPDHARWNSPILFDGPVRDGLRVHGADALDRARLVGDVLAIAPSSTSLRSIRSSCRSHAGAPTSPGRCR